MKLKVMNKCLKSKKEDKRELTARERIFEILDDLLPSSNDEKATDEIMAIIDGIVEEKYKKELVIADDRWKRAERELEKQGEQ